MSTANDILNPTQQQQHQSAVYTGAFKGLIGGLAVSLPTSFILQRRSAYYRSLTPALKAFGIVLVTVPAFVISAERAGIAYERSQFAQWDEIGSAELRTVRQRAQAARESMDVKDRVADFAIRHQYSLISGTWVASMLGAYAWVSRDKLATPLQKITQTRVWAQGLTLGIIISAAILTHGRQHKAYVDHSWRDILEREEEAKRQQQSQQQQQQLQKN